MQKFFPLTLLLHVITKKMTNLRGKNCLNQINIIGNINKIEGLYLVYLFIYAINYYNNQWIIIYTVQNICPKSHEPIYIENNHIKRVKKPWIYSSVH